MIRKEDLLSVLGKRIDEEVRHRFELVLGEQLIKGEMFPQGEYYLFAQKAGLSVLVEREIATAIFLHCGENADAGYRYTGWVGDGVPNEQCGSSAVIGIMGEPKCRGGGGHSFLRKPIPVWVRYDFDDYVIHFEFDDDSRIAKVTVMDPLSAPAC